MGQREVTFTVQLLVPIGSWRKGQGNWDRVSLGYPWIEYHLPFSHVVGNGNSAHSVFKLLFPRSLQTCHYVVNSGIVPTQMFCDHNTGAAYLYVYRLFP